MKSSCIPLLYYYSSPFLIVVIVAERSSGHLSSSHILLMDVRSYETCRLGLSGIRLLFAPSCLIVIAIPISTPSTKLYSVLCLESYSNLKPYVTLLSSPAESFIFTARSQVGISSWGSDAIPGAGVIIFPASNSSSLLVGALFLTSPFPDFVLGSPIPLSPGAMPGYAAPYQSLSPPYASSSRHHQTSSPPEQSYSINHANTGNGQDQYRYMVPRTYSTSSSSSSGDQWPSIKDEDRETYANRYARIS